MCGVSVAQWQMGRATFMKNGCMHDTFASARTRPKGRARATIRYLVYNENGHQGFKPLSMTFP